MALLHLSQLAHGQHVEVSTPQGPMQGIGWDPDKVAGPAAPPEARPTLPDFHTVAVSVSTTVSPHATTWPVAEHVEDVVDRHELDAIALLSRPLPAGVILMGATFGPEGIRIGFANLTDAPVTVSESLRVLLVP